MRSTSVLSALLAVSCLSLSLSALPARAEDLPRFDIPAQPLVDSLRAVASQTNMNVFFEPKLIAGRSAPAVSQTEGLEAALKKLLAGSGLTFRFIDARTVTVVPEGKARLGDPEMAPTASADLQGAFRVAQVDAAAPAGADPANNAGQGEPTAESDSELAEIVVTAQKRLERLQDVPISMSVLSGKELDKTTTQGLLEALNRTPGVVSYGLDRPLLSIRGVTAGGATSTAGSNPVAYYLDTVPFALARTAIVPDAETYDLERVEVLRGPQGTLYGASAQTGVVRVLTKNPDLDGFELKARTSFSNTQDGSGNLRGDAALNIPIMPGKLAVRGVASYQDLSGWIDKPNEEDVNDAEIRSARLKVSARPTERLSVDLMGWLSRADHGAPSNSDNNREHASLIDEPLTTDYDLYGVTIGYDSSAFSVRSMTGYLDYDHTDVRDHQPTVLVVPVPRLASRFNAHTFSQEVVLTANPESAWRWTLGGMYRDSKDRFAQNSLGGGIPFDFSQGSESYAAFGEIGRRFADDKLGLTFGLRYFHDDAFIRENVNQGPVGSDPIFRTASFSDTTPRAVLTWYPNDDLTLYGSYSEGFRSGFPQNPSVIRNAPDIPPLKPDTLHNYELGLKAAFWGGRLSLESAAFFMDWRKTQQSLSIAVGSTFITGQVNSESASGPGLEFALKARPLQGLELGASFGWNDLEFDSDVLSRNLALFPEGTRLNGSPEYTAGLSADYEFPLGSAGLTGLVSVSGNYISERAERFLLGTNILSQEGDPTLITRASFAVDSGDRWTASLFVDNLNDEDGASITSVLSPFWSAHVRPRTIGLQLEFNF